jgi:transcriptional regulator with XRE-family HTH domain
LKKSAHQVYLKAFGNNLKVVRKRLGFSQERLAYESEIELRQIGRIERGEINTGILSLKIIADTLGIHFKELMNFDV